MSSPCLVTIVAYFNIRCETRRRFQAKTIVRAVKKKGEVFEELKFLRVKERFTSHLFVEGRT